ncbi:MAG: tetratricopeptide repeat protein [Verrucomicrobiota bacterium]|nr:tetratricopeptide repeat protein [Verrucomicrobiota bacterium]
MTTETQSDPRNNFVPRLLPWLLAAVAFAAYALTLNHWVSLFNLRYVSEISGWTWQPDAFNPLTFLVTLPLRLLSARAVPLALNLFAAVCGALCLLLLARSVALLPHDRTHEERVRERSYFSFLTIRTAWLPPVLAVLACGFELTFWEQATNFTGEIFDLLPFAFVIWSLLEYRLDEREGRLFLAAIVYGASMPENWAMIGFFPFFIAALIWMRGRDFFNGQFFGRMALCGLAGMLFYLLLPTLAVVSDRTGVTFWQMLKYNLATQWHMVRLFFSYSPVRLTVLLLSLTSLLPVAALGIRWKSSFGDTNLQGAMLARVVFHLGSAFFLAACLWVALDPPFSPRLLFPRQAGFALPFLTFYYLGALSIGYFSGYFLLVFGTARDARAQRSKKPQPTPGLNYAVTAAAWLLFVAAPAVLLWKNAPQIRATNGDTWRRYASLMEKELPRSGGIVLSDDPQRLTLLQAGLASDGRAGEFVPLETQSLYYAAYHHFLHKRFPRRWPDTVAPREETAGVSPLHLLGLLSSLSKTNALYYLHPSFGYYFEQFYPEPHGLVHQLKTLPDDTLLPPLPDPALIAENQAFWSGARTQALPTIARALTPPAPDAPRSWEERIFARLHVEREQNANAVAAGRFYSRSLDFWGVELQRAGDLTNAAAAFVLAQKLNPDNVVARINLAFNRRLQAGKSVPVDLSKATPDQFGQSRDWNEVLTANGPFDDPSFCFENGVLLVGNGLFRQALAQFDRVRQFDPDYLPARLWLAACYVANHQPDRALAALRDVRDHPDRFSLDETNALTVDTTEAAAYFQKTNFTRGGELLQGAMRRNPTNLLLLATASKLYMNAGLYPDALALLDRGLQLSSNSPVWLLNKGYVCIQLKKYKDAVAALTGVLAVETNNPTALFNRAIANLDSDQLDAARADYQTLIEQYTNSFQAAYGLGEIAWRRRQTNDAIRYYPLYLANANTNTPEAHTIAGRLRELERR